MSWSLSYTGRINEKRATGGQFAPGEVLPVALSAEDLAAIERGNPGCSNQAIEVWSAARGLILSGDLGSLESVFAVNVGGHVQTPGTATESVNIHIDRFP